MNEKDKYTGEYPQHKPLYNTPKGLPRQIQPIDHFGPTKMTSNGNLRLMNTDTEQLEVRNENKPEYLIPVKDHFVNDDNVQTWVGNGSRIPENQDASTITNNSPFYTANNQKARSFNAAMTVINQENSPDKAAVMSYGLEDAELNRVNNMMPKDKTLSSATYTKEISAQYIPPPLSPLHPFHRMTDPAMTQSIVNHSYNRFQIPITDIEHRKAFRNLFFTRPECYICCNDGSHPHNKWSLSKQCELDNEIASSASRMPHIVKMLSPVYITGTFGTNNPMDNFNYLLSNRALGFTVSEETLSVNESVGKSIEGYSVIPGMHIESQQGGTINVSFRDTKYLEIYEYFRILMIYIYKRRLGVFEPPFARYDYYNDYPVNFGSIDSKHMAYLLHPYDRALEYTFSLFDIVTNEANDRIIYWCKYYGLYPVSVSISGLNSENAVAMTSDMIVDVTFRYQRKLPCVNKTFVEFNLNAGITDENGKVKSNLTLDASSGFMNKLDFMIMNDSHLNDRSNHLVSYSGAAGMFVGTPYIVMGRYNRDVTNVNGTGDYTVHPYLRFMGVNNDKINHVGNLNITNVSTKPNNDFVAAGTD